MSLENDFHFRISMEGKTYEFDLQVAKPGSGRYSITTNEGDVSAINALLQRAFEKNPSTIEELSHGLRHIPSVTYVSAHPLSKSHRIGVQHLQNVEPKTDMSEKGTLMDQRLQNYCSQRGFQGVVLVIDKGEIALQKGYGSSNENGSPLSINTPFPIGSLTKPITGMTVLDLLDSGSFGSVHGPAEVKITNFLPDDCLPNDPEVLESWKTVTLLDLLNHTSGLPEFEKYIDQLMEAKEGQISKPIAPEDVLALIRECPIKGGSDYCYSNFGYHLIGKMIEHVIKPVSGESFENHINKFLAEKGLENSGYVGTKSTALPTAMQWTGSKTVNIDPSQLDPPSEAYSSGGLYSTVEDLSKMLRTIHPPLSLEYAGHAELHDKDFRPNYACHLGWNYSANVDQQEIWKNGAVGGFGALMVSYRF